MEAFIGTILPSIYYNFAPVGWLVCNGAQLSIANYTALYSLLGTRFGGDGTSTFCLPDLRGAVPIGSGTYTGSEGTAAYTQGAHGGSFSSSIGSHTHTASTSGGAFTAQQSGAFILASTNPATSPSPAVGFLPAAANATDNSGSGSAPTVYLYASSANASLADVAVTSMSGITATVQPNIPSAGTFGNMQPYVVANYIICVQGLYPTPA